MNIVDLFRLHFGTNTPATNDFSLIEYGSRILIGVDKASYVCVVVKSANPNRFPLKHKTQNMSIECNVKVHYSLHGNAFNDVVHIIRCLSEKQREKELFLELAAVLIQESDGSEEAIMDTFNTLRTFFNDKKEVSDNELIGLYAELYTICRYEACIGLGKYWQSRDRMKFDFSISDKIKLEVKATTKNSRTHHFRHEQLMTELYDIYVLSYMLRYDDEGLSLYDVLIASKRILEVDSRKLIKINYILKNVSEDRLKGMRFNKEFTESHRHFYQAADIPKFNQVAPMGVANAEYDCVLDTVSYIDDQMFIEIVESIKREVPYV
ncbi:MAG: PD-(D/E)XK motif protein [Oscillospiraceae bacterium]|nr:PD-(D/E)XK motif protein [Oscillospiraceae bacterium]